MARQEIEQFKYDYRLRFPGRNPDDLTDEDLLREVMNTVGKQGKLGEQIRCVVSVSMLTKAGMPALLPYPGSSCFWDATPVRTGCWAGTTPDQPCRQ